MTGNSRIKYQYLFAFAGANGKNGHRHFAWANAVATAMQEAEAAAEVQNPIFLGTNLGKLLVSGPTDADYCCLLRRILRLWRKREWRGWEGMRVAVRSKPKR